MSEFMDPKLLVTAYLTLYDFNSKLVLQVSEWACDVTNVEYLY